MVAAFPPGAIRFNEHYSGWNSSRAGMFSLFYGLPATYFDAFADIARPPVVMDLFRQYDYQLGLFASSPVYRAAVGLDRTALARVPNLRLETGSPYPGSSGRDRTITEEWLRWLARGIRRIPSSASCTTTRGRDRAAREPTLCRCLSGGALGSGGLHSRYLSAVHYVDALVGQVLDDLERRKLLERTVVIVTSDHAGVRQTVLGFTGTARPSASSRCTRRWCCAGRDGHRPRVRRTSTTTSRRPCSPSVRLRQSASDYASGRASSRPRSGPGSLPRLQRLALIEPDRVTVVLPAGSRSATELPAPPNPTLPRDGLRAAVREMSRFYR